MSDSHTNVTNLEKNLYNRVTKRFKKTLKLLKDTDLNFEDLKEERNFLNQLYFLNHAFRDLEYNLDEMNHVLAERQRKKEIQHQTELQLINEKNRKDFLKVIAPILYYSSENRDDRDNR